LAICKRRNRKTQANPATRSPEENRLAKFSSIVLGETEDTWQRVFAESNRQYVMPKMVLFTGAVPSACGSATAAMGPFYVRATKSVLDLCFRRTAYKNSARPATCQAYVIAHEVGHHVQNLLGISDKVSAAQQPRQRADANACRCAWSCKLIALRAYGQIAPTNRAIFLEQGDIESALNAAAGVATTACKNNRKATSGRNHSRMALLNSGCAGSPSARKR